MRLRVTQRCAQADLHLSDKSSARDAQNIAVEHEALRTFAGKRSTAPGDGENILNVHPYGHIKSLHVGKGRAATIYDPDEDVCWLLAYSDTHAVGERRDAYAYFERLDRRNELLPTASDYVALKTVTAASLMDTLRSRGREILVAARAHPGREVGKAFELNDGQDALITVSVEVIVVAAESAEQGWLSFSLPYDAPIDQDRLLDVIADLLPEDVDPDGVSPTADVNGRPIAYNELAYTWERYSAE